jgi:hypothetical protein
MFRVNLILQAFRKKEAKAPVIPPISDNTSSSAPLPVTNVSSGEPGQGTPSIEITDAIDAPSVNISSEVKVEKEERASEANLFDTGIAGEDAFKRAMNEELHNQQTPKGKKLLLMNVTKISKYLCSC